MCVFERLEIMGNNGGGGSLDKQQQEELSSDLKQAYSDFHSKLAAS